MNSPDELGAGAARARPIPILHSFLLLFCFVLFCFFLIAPQSVACWVRLPELPAEYYDDQILYKIAKEIGRPIKMDVNTAE